MFNHPCKKDCPNRSVGCHGICQDYKAFRSEREEVYKARSLDYEAVDYTINVIRKNRR